MHVQTTRHSEVVFMPKHRTIEFSLSEVYNKAKNTTQGIRKGRNEAQTIDMQTPKNPRSCLMEWPMTASRQPTSKENDGISVVNQRC